MAIVITSNSGKAHYALQEWVCDTEEDILDLPIENIWVGSTAYIIDAKKTYMFTSTGEWKEVQK